MTRTSMSLIRRTSLLLLATAVFAGGSIASTSVALAAPPRTAQVAATAVPVVPPVLSLATCVGYAPVFNVQGGDSSTYQDLRITGIYEGDLEPSVSESVITDSSATIETPERPGNWTYGFELRNTEGEPVFAGGQTIVVKLPCADPDPETYVFKIPPAPGREYVNDDPAKEGDACYSVDKLAVLNTDQLVYGVVDCAPTVTIIQPNTVFTDGTTTVTYPKPVDVYTPPVTPTPSPTPTPTVTATPTPTPTPSASATPGASPSPSTSATAVPVAAKGTLAATGLDAPTTLTIAGALVAVLLGIAMIVRRKKLLG